jgi:hypothetical protein
LIREKSSRLQNAEGPKNTFPELVAEKRLKYFGREVAHHAAGAGDCSTGAGDLAIDLPTCSIHCHCIVVLLKNLTIAEAFLPHSSSEPSL